MRRILLPAVLAVLMIFSLATCNTANITTGSPLPSTVLPDASEPETATVPPAPPNSQSTDLPTSSLPASGPLTVATLGDSLTEGEGDDSGLGGYPSRLKTLLEALHPGTTLLNLGHSGWAAPDLINGLNGEPSELEQAVAARTNIVTVWIGSNDLWYLYEYGPDPMTAEAEQQDLQAYEANIDTILKRLAKSGATVFIALLDDQSKRAVVANPPNPAEPALPSTTTDDLARMSAHITAYNEIIRRKAAEYGAVTVNFYDTNIFTNPATIYDDGNHPNTAGYEQITKIWFAAIQPYLK